MSHFLTGIGLRQFLAVTTLIAISISAFAQGTGGTTHMTGADQVHTFTSSGTFTLSKTTTIQYLVMGGGGSDSPLAVSSISTTGDYYVSLMNGLAPSCPFTVAAGGSATIIMTFDATVLGTRAGPLSIVNSSSNLPNYSTALTGFGTEGVLSIGWGPVY